MAVATLIDDEADEIRFYAEKGEPPLTAIYCALDEIICERIDWSRADWMIRDRLGPDFKEVDPVTISILHGSSRWKALCYRRSMP